MSYVLTADHGPCGAMSVDQFAKWAGIGRTLAWEQVRLGELQAVKVGRRTLVTTAAADLWLSSRPVLLTREIDHAA